MEAHNVVLKLYKTVWKWLVLQAPLHKGGGAASGGREFLKLTNYNVFIVSNLHSAIDLFWNKVMNNLENTKNISVIIRVEMSDGSYLTLTPILRIDKSDKALFK